MQDGPHPVTVMTAFAACLLVIFFAVHHLAKAYAKACELAAQRGGVAAKARVGGLAIVLVAAGLAAALMCGGILVVIWGFYL